MFDGTGLPCRALRVRKKMSGDRMPVKMIGDILTNQLPHMQSYIRWDFISSTHRLSGRVVDFVLLLLCRFCSCQLNGATLIQQKTDDNPDIKDFLKVQVWILRNCCKYCSFKLMIVTAAKVTLETKVA